MNIKVVYKDKNLEYQKGISLADIAKEFKSDYKHNILVATLNNKVVSLDTKLTRDCTIDFFDITSTIGSNAYEKGAIFLFVKAVRDVLNCDVKILHSIENGIYCEVLSNNLISEVTIEKIKMKMRDIVNASLSMSKIMVSRIDAIDYYMKIKQEDKAKSLRYISNSSISLYKLDDMLDYFYGVLPNNTKLIDKFNIKYLKENKVILLIPSSYNLNSELKFIKNDKILELVEKNDKYLCSVGIDISTELNNIISTGNYGDLIRISETLQNDRLLEISDKIIKNKEIKMILITGPSSSGKTTTSKKLSLFLRSKGLKPLPISIDDFMINTKDRVLNESGEPEKERISIIDTNLFNKKISELLASKEVNLPRFNFETGLQETSDKKIKMEEKSILIVEGIHAFNPELTEMIPDKNKFKLFISPLTPLNIDNHNMFKWFDNRLLRRVVRDNRSRGTSASETLKMWKNVRKVEEEDVLPYIKDADEIFNTSLVYELGVLKTYAEPLLFSVREDDENYDEAIRLINLFRVILGIPSEEVPNDSIIREFIGGSCFKD